MKLTQLGRGAAETGAGRDQFLPEGNGCELFGVRASFVVRQEPRAEEGLPSLALRLSGGLGVSGEEGRLSEARFCQAGPSAARAPPGFAPCDSRALLRLAEPLLCARPAAFFTRAASFPRHEPRKGLLMAVSVHPAS